MQSANQNAQGPAHRRSVSVVIGNEWTGLGHWCETGLMGAESRHIKKSAGGVTSCPPTRAHLLLSIIKMWLNI